MFSFEAGRRCDSGPGNFTFDTKQGNEIFTLVDQAIQSQKALAEEHHLSCPSNFEQDCPASLQQIFNGVPNMVVASGDSSSCSSREADGDSGGSKPGSADGVLGKREGGDGGGRGQSAGAGHKGRSLPEPPSMPGVPPRAQVAAKGLPTAEEHVGLYSEPADSVRLPLIASDCLYSDPVDSIKGQNKTSSASNPPVPTPRLRPVADDTSGGGIQGDHHLAGSNSRKLPDLYSHVYDRISLDLNQKTSALSLNEAAGGGRGLNWNRRPLGGKTEGGSSPVPPEHIYDEPEGCAKVDTNVSVSQGMSIYDEARLEPQTGPEGNYCAPSHRHSPPHLGPSRGTLQPLRWSKPIKAPKPVQSAFSWKELPHGKHGGPGSNVNNNNNIWVGESKDLYSKVSKQKPPSSTSWYSHQKQAALRSPDIIYDNLGNI